ncbi:hypothetical protein GCM10010168_64620 [Actinoplanes ianthinogenes]|uniref:Uncharacterized protein n=1 Tax=Actinoplanes ianthinogenes TaxID=122358 RepID=A0ABM7LSC6_9ACTN|nr:hypothetical protein [Actinoplanes ianthinogenes]BCJ42160.1 hypothetical protein Aiant_28170 [Actinoplanes ianthinogenes]GGR37335.1 hypothetical protein GCM10010168_64620 [Actinoplanes ianthinogenes]
MSPVRALPAELAAVRALIADGLAEIVRAADDREQFWIRSAITHLATADAILAELPGARRSTSRRFAVATLMTAAVTAGGAALARAAGAGPGGVLAVCGAALLLTMYLARQVRPRGATPTLPSPPDSPGLGLIAVPASLERARGQLVSAALRRAGSANWPVPALRRAVAADPVLGRLAHADLLLCQAIDCLDRYLDDLEKQWP